MKHTLLFIAFMFLFFQCAFAQNYILDNTFGTNGEVTNPSITSGQYLQQQSDGKIVSCYLSSYSIAGNVHITRFNVDGSIDTTFGTNGYLNTSAVSETAGRSMIAIQNDGKIIVTGSFYDVLTNKYIFFTERFNSDGSFDNNFGIDSYSMTNFNGTVGDFSKVIEIQSDGKILVGGYIEYSNGNVDAAIVRYLSNGQPDTSFGTDGIFTYNLGTCTIPNHSIYSDDFVDAIKVNSIGKIIVGVTTDVNKSTNQNDEYGFICLNSDGTLDTSFGNNGQKIVDIGDTNYLNVLKLTADDKIFATGEHDYKIGTDTYSKISIVKLLANGNLDASFGNNGIVLTNRDATNLFDFTYDLSIQPDGKIIGFGQTPNSTFTAADFLLIRFNTDGTIDSTFNSVGYIAVDFNNTPALGSSFLIQNDGKIISAGAINLSSSASGVGCLARLEIDNLSTKSFDNNKFYISPNPFTDSITISTKDINLSLATLELYDISGRKISNFTTENTNNFTFSINSNLSKGNYFLKITDQQTTQTFKLLKE